MILKKKLAFTLTEWLNSKKDAEDAQAAFEKTFQEGKPEFSREVEAKETLAETIAAFTKLGSVSDAKRMIAQGGVDVNGKEATDANMKLASGDEIKVGKKTFLKIK